MIDYGDRKDSSHSNPATSRAPPTCGTCALPHSNDPEETSREKYIVMPIIIIAVSAITILIIRRPRSQVVRPITQPKSFKSSEVFQSLPATSNISQRLPNRPRYSKVVKVFQSIHKYFEVFRSPRKSSEAFGSLPVFPVLQMLPTASEGFRSLSSL